MAVNPCFMLKQEEESAKLYEEIFSTGPVQLMNYGEIEMELQGTFFAKGHAVLTDESGIKWQPSCLNA